MNVTELMFHHIRWKKYNASENRSKLVCYARNMYLLQLARCKLQDDQLPGKKTSSPEARNFKKLGNFFYFMDVFTNFHEYLCQRTAILIRSWMDFMMSNIKI